MTLDMLYTAQIRTPGAGRSFFKLSGIPSSDRQYLIISPLSNMFRNHPVTYKDYLGEELYA